MCFEPRDEAVLCYIQDGNVFWESRKCKMLDNDYTRRLHETYDIYTYSYQIDIILIQEILYNEYVEIRVDFRIKTETTPSEIGITSQDSLKIVQTQKLRKYDLVANGLGIFYKLCGDNSLCGGPETVFSERASLSVILVAEMYKQPISALKQVDMEEDNLKYTDHPQYTHLGTTR
ncbi:hypothetical protein CWI38_0013p0020 [Hamiltosporidium tvaerminnensis]|uniref:Uncharacterized protein n=1 Tax=Hamiltosporidium tvaerminnensis TaxID=1176355 RepID=A0A4Q9M5M1_9MICR|nr:hypothetical protein CWI38_0013p0020 [Hamiltosporidium tvaerminnensis]